MRTTTQLSARSGNGLSRSADARHWLAKLANRKAAASLQKYFKTRPGEYGEGDRFIGIRVPRLHEAADRFAQLPHEDVDELLCSPIHEHRSLALMILVRQYDAGDERRREKIFRHYLRRTKHVNNWDLVDCSARDIVGRHLWKGDVSLLHRLAKSSNLWERRIAIIATYYFITQRKFDVTIKLAKGLLNDPHDLMHKAVGWMLHEIEKRDPMTLDRFFYR